MEDRSGLSNSLTTERSPTDIPGQEQASKLSIACATFPCCHQHSWYMQSTIWHLGHPWAHLWTVTQAANFFICEEHFLGRLYHLPPSEKARGYEQSYKGGVLVLKMNLSSSQKGSGLASWQCRLNHGRCSPNSDDLGSWVQPSATRVLK